MSQPGLGLKPQKNRSGNKMEKSKRTTKILRGKKKVFKKIKIKKGKKKTKKKTSLSSYYRLL